MWNKSLLELEVPSMYVLAITTEAANQFAISVDVKHRPAVTEQQEDITIHRYNAAIPIVIPPSKLPPDFCDRQFNVVVVDPDLGFVVLQQPYINNCLVIVKGKDAKIVIHLKDKWPGRNKWSTHVPERLGCGVKHQYRSAFALMLHWEPMQAITGQGRCVEAQPWRCFWPLNIPGWLDGAQRENMAANFIFRLQRPNDRATNSVQ